MYSRGEQRAKSGEDEDEESDEEKREVE